MLRISENQALIVEDLNQGTQNFTGKAPKSSAFTCCTLILHGLSHPTSKMGKVAFPQGCQKVLQEIPKEINSVVF